MNEPIPTRADELTEGDIIRYLDDELMVYSAPIHTIRGIEFDALPIAIEGLETQEMCLPLEEVVQRSVEVMTVYLLHFGSLISENYWGFSIQTISMEIANPPDEP